MDLKACIMFGFCVSFMYDFQLVELDFEAATKYVNNFIFYLQLNFCF